MNSQFTVFQVFGRCQRTGSFSSGWPSSPSDSQGFIRHRHNCSRSPRNGFSLVELLLSLVVLGLIIAPLYLAFSGSRKQMTAARDQTIAVSLAASCMAALRTLEPASLPDLRFTRDTDLTGTLALDRLGLATAPAGFERSLSLLRVDAEKREGGPFVQAEILVRWKKGTSSYLLQGLLRGHP